MVSDYAAALIISSVDFVETREHAAIITVDLHVAKWAFFGLTFRYLQCFPTKITINSRSILGQMR
jgi:hypothetical protein